MDEGEAGVRASESLRTNLVGTAMSVAGSHLALGPKMGKPFAINEQVDRYPMLKALEAIERKVAGHYLRVERLSAKPQYKRQGTTP